MDTDDRYEAVVTLNDGRKARISHRGRTVWTFRTATKHADDYAKRHAGTFTVIEVLPA